VRLMTNSRYPLTYNDEHEAQTREKFSQAFSKGKVANFIRKIQQMDSFVSFESFKEVIDSFTNKLEHQDIDCAFVYLSRGAIPFKDVEKMSD
jgi:hypothetical protein